MSEHLQQFDFEKLRADMSGSTGLASDLHEQNSRFALGGSIRDVDFAALAKEGVKLEQAETITRLKESICDTDFEQVGEADLYLAREMAALALEREQIEISLAEAYAGIDSDLEETIRIAPGMTERARILADQKRLGIQAEVEGSITGREDSVRQAQAQIQALFEEFGQPWPLPEAYYFQNEDPVAIVETIDQIPVEPVLTSVTRERFKALQTRHVDAPHASLFIAMYLAENAGQVVTVEELVEFLYKPAVREERPRDALRTRVTTLLGPLVQGRRIKSILRNEGYVLQYGFRQTKTEMPDGKIVYSPRTRIYRALSRDQAEELAGVGKIFESNRVRIVYETSPFDELSSLEAKEEPKEAARPEQIVSHIPDIVTTRAQEPEVSKSSIRQGSTETKQSEWQSDFKRAIGAAIEEIAGWGLMQREPVPLNTASIRAKSTKFATNEAVRRISNAGVIGKVLEGQEHKLQVGPYEMVAMRLFNTHPELKKGTRQREAKALIRAAIESYFSKQEAK